MDRSLFSETIRSLYRIYGYEAVMKEVLFVHHMWGAPSAPVLSAPPVSVLTAPAPPAPPVSVPNSDMKEIQVEQQVEQVEEQKCVEIKHTRPTIPDKNRCTVTLSNGERCGGRRAKSDTMCHRHKGIREKDQQREQESSD
jgi:hypothetical protein